MKSAGPRIFGLCLWGLLLASNSASGANRAAVLGQLALDALERAAEFIEDVRRFDPEDFARFLDDVRAGDGSFEVVGDWREFTFSRGDIRFTVSKSESEFEPGVFQLEQARVIRALSQDDRVPFNRFFLSQLHMLNYWLAPGRFEMNPLDKRLVDKLLEIPKPLSHIKEPPLQDLKDGAILREKLPLSREDLESVITRIDDVLAEPEDVEKLRGIGPFLRGIRESFVEIQKIVDFI